MKETFNSLLYQPFASGLRPGVPVGGPGDVASYFSDAVTFSLVFPARSVQDPVIVWFGPSGPEYVGPEQEAIPEVASPPVTPSATGWLYQPFASGGRASVPVADGGVASYLKVKLAGVESTFPAPSVHAPERVTDAASGPP